MSHCGKNQHEYVEMMSEDEDEDDEDTLATPGYSGATFPTPVKIIGPVMEDRYVQTLLCHLNQKKAILLIKLSLDSQSRLRLIK